MRRLLRRALSPLGALLVLACCGRSSTSVPTETLPDPSEQTIRLTDSTLRKGESDTVRFGSMRSGEIATKPLVLHNATQRPIVVADVVRNCGCAELEFDRRPLVPGERRAAGMRFDTRGLAGWQFKLVELRFAEGNAPLRLYVEAEVE